MAAPGLCISREAISGINILLVFLFYIFLSLFQYCYVVEC